MPEAIILLAGSALGSYGSVRLLRRVPLTIFRRAVIGIGFSMTTYFFVRGPV